MIDVYATFLVVVYWVITIVWTSLTVIFGQRYLKSKSTVMLTLTIACFAQDFSNTYYCFMVSAQYRFLPHALYPVLSAPFMWLIPKIGLVLGALAIYLAIWKKGR